MRYFPLAFMVVVMSFPTAIVAQKFLAPEQIEGVTRVSAEDVFDLVISQPDLVIIDSRKQEQFKKGHIQGAYNILDSMMTDKLLAKFVSSKSVPIIFYCNGEKCLRSANAAAMAHDWGYKNIYWFRGGWKEWTDKEMPVSHLRK